MHSLNKQYLSFLAGIFFTLSCYSINAAEFRVMQPEEQVVYNQALFEDAMVLVNQGKYAEGTEILSSLYQRTHSPRVKLEWARALYLAEKKSEAKVLFKEILETNPPYMVKEKIHVFLDDISKSEGRFNISFGLISDSNPKNLTSASSVNVFGQQYYYNPNIKPESETGVSYSINANKAFNDRSPWYFGLSINGSKFNNYQYDKTSIEQFVSHRIFDSPRVNLKLSLQEFVFAGKLLYIYPAISFRHTYENANGFYLWDEIKVGKLYYSEYTYLDGFMTNFTSGIGKAFTPQLTLGAELGFDRMNANENPYSFLSSTAGLISNFFIPSLELKTDIKAIKSYKNFDAMDPIFGEIRRDERSGLFATITKTNWSIYGVTPSLEVGFEKNDSSIDIYSYNRVMANLYFRKSF